MKTKIIELVLPAIINALMAAFPEDQIRKMLDGLIDIVEEKIAESDSRIDDAALPLIKLVREFFNIPDYKDI